jgi:CRP/FNR family transcriptional regulator, nitrogen oxide reductase regulator
MAGSEFRDVDVPLFRGLKQHEIDSTLAAARSRRFSAKSVITYQGEPANRLFLLRDGRVRYFFDTARGRKLVMMLITPSHIFGSPALLVPPSTYLASTEAVQDSTALVWDSSTIRNLAHRFPRLMMNVFRTTMDYLAWYIATHAALTSHTARERLSDILLGYAHCIGQKTSGGIELDVTNEELAHAANITPYTVSRLISEWRRSGAIRKHRGRIVLRSGKKLSLRAA